MKKRCDEKGQLLRFGCVSCAAWCKKEGQEEADAEIESLREQLARQSYAFVRARDMWSLLGVAADTAPSLLALWASTVKVACS